MQTEARARWGTRFGFYLAAIGAAFGLGNIWRFPYVVAENGGGAFVFIYLALVFLVGMPFLIGELMLGKVTKSAVVPAMARLASGGGDGISKATDRRRRLLLGSGYFSIFLCLFILAYYSVICGWVLHFLMRFLVSAISPRLIDPATSLEILLNNGWLQIALTSVHLIIIMVAVSRGVEEGLERFIGRMMPLFLVLVLILALQSLSMDSSTEALRFFLYPDFSKLTPEALARALGQVCFTLSIGFGTMVTFGSYMNERSSSAVAGFRVAIFDSIISLVAGIMIFPLIFSLDNREIGPELLFKTVPFMFAKLGVGGEWFGVAFFFCLYLAALGASVSLLETTVSNLRETRRLKRNRATLLAVGACLFFSVIPAFSSSVLKGFTIFGASWLEAWDGLLINWLLPLAALIISQIVVRRVDHEIQQAEFDVVPSASLGRLYQHWRFAVRWIAPIVFLIAMLLQI